MFTFEFTSDLELIRAILTGKRVWYRMVCDAAPAPEALHLAPCDSIRYAVIRREQSPVGMFLLLGNQTEAEVHFCFLPEIWGESWKIGQQAVAWIWQQTQLRKMVGPVPEFNRLALQFARKLGFQETPPIPSGHTKHGKPYNLIPLLLMRP